MKYNYNSFLKPFNTEDKNLLIYDNTDTLVYNVNPFSITNTQVRSTIVSINIKSGRTILLDFQTSANAITALGILQTRIKDLTRDKSVHIDKKIENWIESLDLVSTTPAATASLVTYDFNTGSIWYHSTATSNYTADFVNLPTTDNRAITATIIISQGATGYSPNALRISGVTQSIKWSSGTYSVSTNKVDIVGFTFLRTSGTWSQVFGQISSFS